MSKIKDLMKARQKETTGERLARECEEAAEIVAPLKSAVSLPVMSYQPKKHVIDLDRFGGIVSKRDWDEVAVILQKRGWELSEDAGFIKYSA